MIQSSPFCPGGEKAAVALPVLDCAAALRAEARGPGRLAVAPPRQPWIKRTVNQGGEVGTSTHDAYHSWLKDARNIPWRREDVVGGHAKANWVMVGTNSYVFFYYGGP